MSLTRRSALLTAGAALATPALAQGMRTRRGASTLTASSDDVMAFAEAVRLMKRRNDALSWARQTRIHAREAQHGNHLFLPWHRLQLMHLEAIVARLTGHSTFAMPYWDWQGDRFMPDWISDDASPLFERRRSRGVATLDFAEARWAESRYVARLAADDFPTFHGRSDSEPGMVEAYGHNHIHQLVGGLMGRPETASADPFFWLHHANIDRVWATWQAGQAASVYPADWREKSLTGFVDADGRDVSSWRVDRTLSTRALGYAYDRLYPFPAFSVTEVGPPGATRRVPTGGEVFRLQAVGEGGRASLALPEALVGRLREADDTLMITARGSVAHARTPLLEDRSVEISIRSGSRTIRLGSSPTFVHIAGGDHAHHRAGYRTPFRFGEEVLNIVDDGPLTVVVETEDLAPEAARPAAVLIGIELELTLTETRWA